MNDIEFYKMSGAGNDFILIDNREAVFDFADVPFAVSRLCRRRHSIGADGLILIENPDGSEVDFKWRFYNSDGSEAEMCGNAARCAARLSFLLGISKRTLSFLTGAGVIHAKILESGGVSVKMTDPSDLRLEEEIALYSYNAGSKTGFDFVDTGVPHVVIDAGDDRALSGLDMEKAGSEVRYHEDFRPAGTNVNFVSHVDGSTIRIRTYERGVEGETLACGTGAVAAAVISHLKGKVSPPVTVVPTSGIPLTIHFEADGDKIGEVFLEGDARLVYRGFFSPEALD
ncbi:MAG: diaminopimelate epimerase [Deltaproteobacteria bacterium]|uniref:Diaminopimelate epimerase n=1 Tax=Candidatus Zymogenus saltonus TaxID=2844893 RepID=A0A9D8KES4_9DELT|nr:diaminopimelate epimerase [Candidatus Zymogenus saltonus]